MTTYVRMTLDQFRTRLAKNRYDSVTAARRGMCKLPMSPAQKAATLQLIDEHFAGKGANVGAKQDDVAPSLKALRSALKALKASTKSGWGPIAETCGVHVKTMHKLMNPDTNPEKISSNTLQLVQKHLQKLNALPGELAEAGLITLPKPKAARPKTHAVTKVRVTPALIEEINEIDLDARELDNLSRERALLDRMRQRITIPAVHMNGASGKYSKTTG